MSVRTEPGPGTASAAQLVDEDTLAELAAISTDGLAVLDAERRFIYVNPAGAAILRVEAQQILGQPALVFDRGEEVGEDRVLSVPNADGARRIRHSEQRHGERTLVVFSDTTDAHRRQRQLAAFAETATALAERLHLQDLLDDVTVALLRATGTAACTVVLFGAGGERIEQVATAGGYPGDYLERLDGCRRRGAPLASLRAYRTGSAVVEADWARQVLADPRWAPMHPVIRGRNWAALVATPLLVRDTAIGALTAFYPSGQQPAPADVAYLSSISSLVAVAVRNHRLVSELEAKAAVEERNRIARELHDSVSQMLFSLNLRSRALRRANESPAPGRRERVQRGLEEIHWLTEGVLGEMRALIAQLRPHELEGDGIVGAVNGYASALTARAEVVIDVEAADLPELSAGTETQVFRIVQEALNNAVRHANARRIRVAIGPSDEPSRLQVLVEDDGDGFDPSAARPGHFGLRTMRERCEELGGSLTVTSRPGCSSVIAEIDLAGGKPTPAREPAS
jgi:signal transduction histidine kinase